MDLLRLLEASLVLFGITSGVLGLLVGSFLNVVIYRLPIMINRAWSRECSELQGNAGAR